MATERPPSFEDSHELADEAQVNSGAEIDVGGLTCCGMDHTGKCTSCFCLCARKIESEPDDKFCRSWFLGGSFANHTLGQNSTDFSRSVFGTLWPLWLLITFLMFLIEIIVRVVILIVAGVLLLVGGVVVVAVVAVVVVLLVVLFILSLVLCCPCYVIAICYKLSK